MAKVEGKIKDIRQDIMDIQNTWRKTLPFVV